MLYLVLNSSYDRYLPLFLRRYCTKYTPRSLQVFQYKDFPLIVISLLFHIIKSALKQSSLHCILVSQFAKVIYFLREHIIAFFVLALIDMQFLGNLLHNFKSNKITFKQQVPCLAPSIYQGDKISIAVLSVNYF